MTYITPDTCILLSLLKLNIHSIDNQFEELLFWFENRHLGCITTPNLLREWERHKTSSKNQIIVELKKADEHFSKTLTLIDPANSTVQSDLIEKVLNRRIDRLDNLLYTIAEIADEEESIIREAAARSINCIAPCHDKDSFRDSLNILHLLSFIKRNGYTDCYFVTNNHKDFSDKEDRFTIHSQLKSDFADGSLQYIYFEVEQNYAGKFMQIMRSRGLPVFSEHLNEVQRKEKEKELEERKKEQVHTMKSTEMDYLENIQHIDTILKKKEPTIVEKKILELLFAENPAYRTYFMENLGKYGMA